MKSATEFLTEDSFEPGKIGQVITQLQALPIPANEKIDLLQSWSRAVGAQVSSSQYHAVEFSGTEYKGG